MGSQRPNTGLCKHLNSYVDRLKVTSVSLQNEERGILKVNARLRPVALHREASSIGPLQILRESDLLLRSTTAHVQ